MRKGNKLKALQRTHSHRKAMLNNMITSLFYHESIQTTVAKAKVARSMAEKLITRARQNSESELDSSGKVHNVRQAAKAVREDEVLHKLFNDIAPRYEGVPGGYTRILKLGRRASDGAEMALLELTRKKDLAQIKEDRKDLRENRKKKSDSKE
jgi:large subunit ribosomal protein L17